MPRQLPPGLILIGHTDYLRAMMYIRREVGDSDNINTNGIGRLRRALIPSYILYFTYTTEGLMMAELAGHPTRGVAALPRTPFRTVPYQSARAPPPSTLRARRASHALLAYSAEPLSYHRIFYTSQINVHRCPSMPMNNKYYTSKRPTNAPNHASARSPARSSS
eukprot:SAG22_NODE_811_length_7061_cov_84.983338_9_plen_163_part_01